ncbi:hypothetical protein FQN50_001104 [Emmonsiellopsis sp. PD_5]|nr:hypothetical protein FQN50_001104 [Emmonsiellopsis sp. PD_5]
MASIDGSTEKGDIKAIESEKVEADTGNPAVAADEQVDNGSAFSTRDNEWHASYTKKLLRRLDMRLLPLVIPMIILPNFPSTSRWLDDEERAYAEWRLLNDAKEADDSKATTPWEGLKMVLVDWRLYVFVIFQHSSILAQTFQYFFPSIVKTLGFGKIETLLLTVPVWFLTFLVSLLVTYTSGRTGDRSIHIIGLMAISTIGNIIATATSKTGPRFFAMFLMPLGAVAAYQIIVSWVATCFPRPMVKRSSAIAICNMVGNTASIYGSYMYPSDDAPQYIPGGSANAVVCVFVALMAVTVRLINVRENKKLERLEQENDIVDDSRDVRGRGFRYVL